MVTEIQTAPGRLEQVRTLLNSEWIPNDTRERRDDFAEYALRRKLSRSEQRTVRQLRSDLRTMLADRSCTDAVLNAAMERLRIRCVVADGQIAFEHSGDAAGELLCMVLDAVKDRSWPRLKACPDCEWVFYDHSRNASKRWCLMNATPTGGRACGTLAKVRAFRERRAAASDRPGRSVGRRRS